MYKVVNRWFDFFGFVINRKFIFIRSILVSVVYIVINVLEFFNSCLVGMGYSIELKYVIVIGFW